jgi:hypothetical protein
MGVLSSVSVECALHKSFSDFDSVPTCHVRNGA